ncbi:MAG: FxsA family protein [Hyphomicrobiales bacterium]|nr:FxsA family protein [Hyphomicrobiales bacterium]
MRISPIGGLVPIFWFIAEIIAYGVVIQEFGIAIAILIGIVSLGLGIFAFKRLGIGMASLGQPDFSKPESVLAGLRKVGWAAFGAFLLILPGFLSNAIGLFLVMLNPQAWLFSRQPAQTPDQDIVDLDPSDWSAGSEDQVHGDKPGSDSRMTKKFH